MNRSNRSTEPNKNAQEVCTCVSPPCCSPLHPLQRGILCSRLLLPFYTKYRNILQLTYHSPQILRCLFQTTSSRPLLHRRIRHQLLSSPKLPHRSQRLRKHSSSHHWLLSHNPRMRSPRGSPIPANLGIYSSFRHPAGTIHSQVGVDCAHDPCSSRWGCVQFHCGSAVLS